MGIRLSETKLNQLVRGLSAEQYSDLRQKLGLYAVKKDPTHKLNRTVQVFRTKRVSSKQEVLALTGCTDSTYRTYKARLVDAALCILAHAHRDGLHQWLRDIEKAWVLIELGEHRSAYDLAGSILEKSLANEHGAVARLALEIMSSTAQEAYPDEATARLQQVSRQLFELAGTFFSTTDLYELYIAVGSRSSRTLLLRSPQEVAEWRAWEQRADMHERNTDAPLSRWAYLALSKCAVHELKGDLNGAFGWYDRLWQKLTGDQSVIALGDKRFLASFQSYILLAVKTGHTEKARKANALFGQVIADHHSLEVQQEAIHGFFALQIKALSAGGISTAEDLMPFVERMGRARKNGAYHHPDWSPHIRYEMYMGLFNLCFGQGELDACRLMLKWGNGRSLRTETSADLTQLIPLLIAVVSIEGNRKDGELRPGLHDSTAEAAYNRFRRQRETFPVETEMARFLHGLGHATSEAFPALKAECLRNLSELKEDCFYYPNLMHYFNFERWVGSLEV